MEASDDGSSDSSSGDDAEQWEQGGEGYSVEYSLWMLKFLCPRDGCGGTLAPPNPTADVMEVRCAFAHGSCCGSDVWAHWPCPPVRSATTAAACEPTPSFTSTCRRSERMARRASHDTYMRQLVALMV